MEGPLVTHEYSRARYLVTVNESSQQQGGCHTNVMARVELFVAGARVFRTPTA